MSRRRQHLNPLKGPALIPRPPIELPAGPIVEVELGCGDARFLIERARSEPDRVFVGLDIREAFLQQARAARAAADLDNVRLEVCNLIVDADTLFAPGRVSRFFINFPDPWFKRRQQNRRWFDEHTIPALVRALHTQGEIFVQSDVWDVALTLLALLEAQPDLENVCGEWSFYREDNPFGARSSREQICRESALPIWRMLFARQSSSADEQVD